MKVFLPLFLLLLVAVTIVMVVVLYYLRKGIRFFTRLSRGDIDEEEFKRMTDKYYSNKKGDDTHFDEDYFKGKGWQRNTSTGQDRNSSSGSHRRTRTADGVTIIDQRNPNDAEKKIFAHDEGEYVDYVES